MSILRLLLAGGLLVSLNACAAKPKPDYADFFEHHPRSILIVPAFNKTTAVEAPPVFNTTITLPLAERGYYVFPISLTSDILTDLGLTDEGLISQLEPQRFRDVFGADAVLFVTINAWKTTYLVIASSVEVEINYRLVDTATGKVLWDRTQRVVESSGGHGGGGGIGALISMAIQAAVTAMIVDYRPLAQRANLLIVTRPGEGLPAGPYRPDYKTDYAGFRN